MAEEEKMWDMVEIFHQKKPYRQRPTSTEFEWEELPIENRPFPQIVVNLYLNKIPPGYPEPILEKKVRT